MKMCYKLYVDSTGACDYKVYRKVRVVIFYSNILGFGL